jgi:predicted XRE-type DNA-binding protein
MNALDVEGKRFKKLVDQLGIDHQVALAKKRLIESIKAICAEKKISQRTLASMVSGLSQDRVSKIFSGQIDHMSIDKLIEITSALKLKVRISAE